MPLGEGELCFVFKGRNCPDAVHDLNKKISVAQERLLFLCSDFPSLQ